MRIIILPCIALLASGASLMGQARKTGSPEKHLPANITQLTAFGERPAWSPDRKRIAFIGKSFGDVYEIDLRTRLMRTLTGHFQHAGFLRVQFLPNGDYLLIGARTFRDIQATRYEDEELWVMRADGHPERFEAGESALYVADVVDDGGVPRLVNTQEVIRAHQPDCTLEAQDFRFDDTQLIYTCYRDTATRRT